MSVLGFRYFSFKANFFYGSSIYFMADFFLSLNNFFNILNAFQHYIFNIFLRHLKSVYKCYISVCHLSVLELVSRVNLIILQCNSCVAGIYRGMLDIEYEMCSIYDSFTWTLEKIPLH